MMTMLRCYILLLRIRQRTDVLRNYTMNIYLMDPHAHEGVDLLRYTIVWLRDSFAPAQHICEDIDFQSRRT